MRAATEKAPCWVHFGVHALEEGEFFMISVNNTAQKVSRPVTVLQFGEGNFLRGFVDQMIDVANEKGLFNGSIQIVKPISFGSIESLNSQDCVYSVLLRGKKDGATFVEKRVITSVAGAVDPFSDYDSYAAFAHCPQLRFIVSNTTEAGIVFDESDDFSLNPPNSFPGKLTKFLYERFKFFNGALDKGLIILPVELIEDNGGRLLECCQSLVRLWGLPGEFGDWLASANIFCNTLVDRIVTGFPADEIEVLESEFGYIDKQLVVGEPFALWVIECAEPEVLTKEFPLDKAGLPVIFTDNLSPYRERKVRVLNGAHTSSVLAAYLCGLDYVGDMMKDETMRAFLNAAVYGEIVPMVPLPESDARAFADSVMERFENPLIKHSLLAISLNSVSKFKARILPTIMDSYKSGGRSFLMQLPHLCFSLAALMAFYSGEPGDGKLIGGRDGAVYDIVDDAAVLEFFAGNKDMAVQEFVSAFLGREDFWGQDLTKVDGFVDAVTGALESIQEYGMRGAIERLWM